VPVSLLGVYVDDPIAAMLAPATFAQAGVVLAIFLHSKDVNVKALVGPATGLLAGVTKPITYALIMRFRRTILIVVIAVQLVLH
jgi:Phosphotransferase system IIC components, glucose/maltose/N-acetylglucosamine-specific